ncbi:LOW QUALITY PROTEIN: hypothetical protein T265_12664 [Opisthorchis viverrini]|uniref:Uncharacterized protein n=1 Tax=Opisthorchis viverrini TaxID=6198 RepID=A0A075ABM0_OPIVI|nr:LOW QUALITY PROTEIN: hypothetical protein T265_12664 [Opisthorchis viverrini]KER33210.1 LOW QUALITY PROTEIN: hypothetical protein T265_12664 [Opisthorchis viverrini]
MTSREVEVGFEPSTFGTLHRKGIIDFDEISAPLGVDQTDNTPSICSASRPCIKPRQRESTLIKTTPPQYATRRCLVLKPDRVRLHWTKFRQRPSNKKFETVVLFALALSQPLCWNIAIVFPSVSLFLSDTRDWSGSAADTTGGQISRYNTNVGQKHSLPPTNHPHFELVASPRTAHQRLSRCCDPHISTESHLLSATQLRNQVRLATYCTPTPEAPQKASYQLLLNFGQARFHEQSLDFFSTFAYTEWPSETGYFGLYLSNVHMHFLENAKLRFWGFGG